MSEILAAIAGAILAGAFQTIVAIRADRSRRQSTVTAIAAEVQAICMLVRGRRYLEFLHEFAQLIGTDAWGDGFSISMDIRERYFAVYEALAHNLGELEERQVAPIVQFYSLCKAAIDSHRVDGAINQQGSAEDKAGNIKASIAIITQLLRLGDDIVQMPTISLPPILPLTIE